MRDKSFYSDAVVQRADKVSKATKVSGYDAWLLETHLTFDIPGLDVKGERPSSWWCRSTASLRRSTTPRSPTTSRTCWPPPAKCRPSYASTPNPARRSGALRADAVAQP